MQNSIGLNKNILILTIVLFALIVALSVMLGLNKAYSPAPAVVEGSITQAVDKNLLELNAFDAVLSLFAKGDAVSQELDTTLSEVGEINEPLAGLTGDESGLADLNSELNTSSSDDEINAEIDQMLKDASL